ncbi:MAG: hypothetical protein ACRDRT_03755, partial [Pseudonocardiaceae bacterium]
PFVTETPKDSTGNRGNRDRLPVWLALDNPPGMEAWVAEGVVECWLRETRYADFWRADPRGYLFLLRSLQEDTEGFSDEPSGRILDLTLPVWRTGECLLHAGRMAERLGANTVNVTMTWHGLAGRELRAVADPRRSLMPGKICHDAELTSHASVVATEISDTLPELVKSLVHPLYARFGFTEPPDQFYSSEIHRMRT